MLLCICKCCKNTFDGPFQRVSHVSPTTSSVVKSFLINLIKLTLIKHIILSRGPKDTRDVRQIEPRILARGSSRKTYIGFRWVDKCYVRQMKLFNFMNCREIDSSCKLDVMQVAWTSFLIENIYLLLKKS